MSPDRVKVGYVLKMYPRFSETFILTEVLAHEAAGLDVEIFSLRLPNDGKFHEALARVKAPVTYLHGESLKASDFWSDLRKAASAAPEIWEALPHAAHETVDEVHQAVQLARAVRQRGVTHLHAHFGSVATTVARLASRMTGVSYSFTAHAKDIFHDAVLDHDLRQKMRDASAVVTVSEFNDAHLSERFGDDAARVHRIYNGLDLEEFAFEAPRHRARTIVAVGRLIEKKGFEDLVDACGILARGGEEFQCEIIGAGPLAPTLQSRAAALGLAGRVHLLGAQPRGEVINHIRRAAVLAAPCVVGSDGNRDGLPTVILEAMAIGTPVISTDVTGIPEVVRHEETGLLVPQHDPESLAAALARVLNDQRLAENLAGSARPLMEAEFDIHRNTARMRELFRPQPRAVAARMEFART